MKRNIAVVILVLVISSVLLIACGGTSKGPSDNNLAKVLASLNDPTLSNPKIVSGINCEVPANLKANGVSEIWYLSYTASGVDQGRIFLQRINGDWAILKDFYQCTEIK